jgi:hypothetical protein
MYTEGGEGVRAVGDESMSYQPTREFKNLPRITHFTFFSQLFLEHWLLIDSRLLFVRVAKRLMNSRGRIYERKQAWLGTF